MLKKTIIKHTHELTEPTGNEDLVTLAKNQGIKLYGTKSSTISISGMSKSDSKDWLKRFEKAEKKQSDIYTLLKSLQQNDTESALKILDQLQKAKEGVNFNPSQPANSKTPSSPNNPTINFKVAQVTENQAVTSTPSKVAIGGVSIPTSLINSPLHKNTIEDQQKQTLKKDGNFEFLLTSYFSSEFVGEQDFLIEQMTKIANCINDSYTKAYYNWVIKNINNLQLSELKDVSNFEKSEQEHIELNF